MITEASGVLARAGAGLGAPLHYSQVTIVVPPAWTEADCGVKITAPGRGLAYQVRAKYPHNEAYTYVCKYGEMFSSFMQPLPQ